MQARAAGIVLALSVAACSSQEEPSPASATRQNDIPARVQWEANYGYCGEVSLISAALFYGAYLSQYDARALASPGVPQFREDSQLLLGVNDGDAAGRLRLRSERWRGPADAAQFLVWVKSHVLSGHPVAIGLYTNESRFYGAHDPQAGDAEYDHIVPVVAVDSAHPDDAYHPGDALTFSDNALFSGSSDHLFTASFGDLRATRAAANAPGAALYALADARQNYGVALLGVEDAAGDTLPVRVDTSVPGELPAMHDGSAARPSPRPVDLTVTVSGLVAGADYMLYRYDDFAKIPDHAFNASAGAAVDRQPLRASGDTFVARATISSSEIAAFRAVRADAP